MLLKRRGDILYLLCIWIILIVLILLFLVPFWWMLVTSLKTGEDVYLKPYSLWLKNPRWSNYRQVFSALPFLRYLLNTIKVTTFVCLGTLVTSSMAAYAFSRLEFHGRDTLFFLYLATLMVPKQVILIPNFILFKWMGLLDNHLALIFTGIFTAYGTFLLRQFFLGIPKELEEAAVLDGYGPFNRFYHIILPLAKPALTTLFIMTVLQIWNEYLYALVFIQSDKRRTVTLGLALFRGDYDIQWNIVMAATLVSIVPILCIYIPAQKYFVEGIALSGVKG